jgi:hypothetical protein
MLIRWEATVISLQDSIRGPMDFLGAPASSAWDEEALARAAQMYTMVRWLEKESTLDYTAPIVEAVESHLEVVRNSVHERRKWLRRALSGAAYERTMVNLDIAQAHLLRLAPPEYVRSNMPGLLIQAQSQLNPDDPRYGRLRYLDREAERRDLDFQERSFVIAILEGAAEEGRRAQMRMRDFRNIIFLAAILMGVLVITVAVLGFFRPDLLPLCFEPDGTVVCPTAQASLGTNQQTPSANDVDSVIDRTAGPWDATIVEFVGLLGATIAAASTLRRSRGTGDPYSLPVALALLKMSSGALTAFLGMLLIRAQFIPGLSALDSSAQIVAWAIVLGYAQQIFTRAIDRQAEALLTEATSSPAPVAPAPSATVPQISGEATPAAPLPPATTPQSEGSVSLLSRLRRRFRGSKRDDSSSPRY